MLDPNTRPEAAAPRTSRQRSRSPRCRRPRPHPLRRHRPSQDEKGPALLVGVSSVADAGTLPDWGYGARLRLGLEVERWSLELAYGAWLPRSSRSQTLAGAGGNFTLMETSLGACLHSSRSGHLSVQGCGGPVLVGMRGAGFGVTDPGQATALWGHCSRRRPCGHEPRVRWQRDWASAASRTCRGPLLRYGTWVRSIGPESSRAGRARPGGAVLRTNQWPVSLGRGRRGGGHSQ